MTEHPLGGAGGGRPAANGGHAPRGAGWPRGGGPPHAAAAWAEAAEAAARRAPRRLAAGLLGLLCAALALAHPGARYHAGEALRGALGLRPSHDDAPTFRLSRSKGLCRLEYTVRTYDGANAPACDPRLCAGRHKLRLLRDLPHVRRWSAFDESQYKAMFNTVSGWLQPSQVAYVKAFTAFQHSLGLYGAVGEVGVHHGKFLMPIVGHALQGEPAVAADLFEQQDSNLDGSGRGSKSYLLHNLEAAGIPERSLTLLGGNSLTLRAANFTARGLPAFRLVSVDGGHTLEITLHDMMLASCLVRDGGLVVLDDFPNPVWVGVAEALMHFTHAQDRLVPFMHGYNKVWFATRSHVAAYADFIASRPDEAGTRAQRLRRGAARGRARSVRTAARVGLQAPRGARGAMFPAQQARGEQFKELADMPSQGTREVEGLAFKMASNLGKLKRKVDLLGTAKDTVQHREELGALNRSIQAAAKAIKAQLEALSRERAALPEPQQAKLRKLVQDFAATLQDYKAAQKVAAEREALYLPRTPPAAPARGGGGGGSAAAAAAGGSEADVESQALLAERAQLESAALDGNIAYQEALIEERDQGIAEIQRQIGEVNEMFQDLAVLIHDQGQQLTTIDTQIASTTERTREGHRQLVKAERSQRAARNKCLMLWLVSGLVLAVILIVLFAPASRPSRAPPPEEEPRAPLASMSALLASGRVDADASVDQERFAALMEPKSASRGARPFLNLPDAAVRGGGPDADGATVQPGGLDRPLNAYAPPPGAALTPDAGGPTPPITARASLSASQSLDYRSKQLALLGPLRPQPTKIWKRKFVKVMVVGDSGLGKTTLISALLSKPGEQLQVHDGTNTPLGQFLKDPDSLVTRVTWKDEQDKVVWVFRVQDTPGYGDEQDISKHIGLIVGHINAQNRKWLGMESARDRCIDLIDVEDPRVDVCLYCLPPHRLRQNDVRYMAELSRHVPIIPVIMKADTMTIHEATRFRQEVVNRLQNPALSGVRGKIETFTFSPGTMERAGLPASAAMSIPPFVVIASNDINQAALQDDPPTYWPERSYKWGTAEAFNPDHSDLLFLRSLLMAEALEEVSVDKRARYEEWRAAHLSTPLFSGLRRRLTRFALATVAPAALFVFAAQHGFDRARMLDAARDAGTRAKDHVLRKARRGSAKAAPAPAPRAPPVPLGGETAAAAALREAEAAILAAEAAQAAALEELQRSRAAAVVPAPPPKKKGWF
ncbi:SYP22 [Scenedesmus sp. PABB004]|nr:SYP22 [Scenedesmus sp. PABB004]